MAEITQLKILADELGGLFLQKSFLAPTGVDPKTSEFSVDQQLKSSKTPLFSKVATIIQAASSKTKNKMGVASEFQPMELDAINAIRPQSNRYEPPQRQGLQNYNPSQPKNNLLVDKATRFRGLGLNGDLKARYGESCHYCKQEGHWYNNCKLYWDDVKNRIIDVPPRDFDQPQSNYLLPNRPQQQQARLRQLDIPEMHDGKILIDSGASTHVSGSLDMFISKEELDCPLKITLAVTDCTVDVRFKGTLSINTNKGNLKIENVYYVPGVDGVILSVGRLVNLGWKLTFERNIARLISPNSIVFNTIYRNYCWFLDMLNPSLQMNKITH
jgi:hypothetical protein